MKKSLHLKLSLVLLLIILLLAVVISAFLIRGVQAFYMEEFFTQMQTFFGDPEIADELRSTQAHGGRTEYQMLAERLGMYSGRLGIFYGTRQYFIRDAVSGAYLTGSELPPDGILPVSANVLLAMSGQMGSLSDLQAGFMDLALPITLASGNHYIIQIIDSKQTAEALSANLSTIIWRTAVIGFFLSIALSFLLSKTLVDPIRNLRWAAERVARGDFSRKIENFAQDEIGDLAATFNDMASQLSETVQKLEQAAQVQKEFVANASHELRTPLTSVRSYAETLLENPGISSETRIELLRVVVEESDRMRHIVQDLLTLAQLDGKRSALEMENFSFQAVITRAVRAIELSAQEKNLQISSDFPQAPISMLGYRPGVEQIVLNIVSNAVKYTGSGGQVSLVAKLHGGSVQLLVADTGVGIPQEDIPRIFDRFYRVDKDRNRESGGTGLGLGIAREMAERAGGSIHLESTLGVGTTVTITLPLEDKDYDGQKRTS